MFPSFFKTIISYFGQLLEDVPVYRFMVSDCGNLKVDLFFSAIHESQGSLGNQWSAWRSSKYMGQLKELIRPWQSSKWYLYIDQLPCHTFWLFTNSFWLRFVFFGVDWPDLKWTELNKNKPNRWLDSFGLIKWSLWIDQWIDIDRQTNGQTDRQAGRQAGRQANKQAGRQTSRQAGKQASKKARKQASTPTNEQTNKHTNTQTNKQTNK